jgi:hypothetical protein
MNMTVTLTDNAVRILREKVTKRIGYGAYLSTLVVAEAAREETRALALAHERTRPTRQSWEESGVRVD